ncbi:hypothetical protein ABL78_3999 [Leptomonas seymouri]|uniref:Uncharacterized protein n=1 Tax=Leptomonas seymouri TaxID=5684 RepID=A0A0N1IKM0_LEPSE|nr:hypothetical protein ABL78_3999 [Leptomonas seymouri]|eukprot:KPI86953.1 hypothetical protein ABL78_3999 [Leptomonas seymouri]
MITEEDQQTVLLCKPSCQHAHHIIIQELQDSGLTVDRRLFNITPEQAIDVVLQYPTVKVRVADRLSAKPNTAGSADVTSAGGVVAADTEEYADRATEMPEFIKATRRHCERHRVSQLRTTEPDHRLLSQVLQLTQRNRTHPAANNATGGGGGGGGGAAMQKRLSISQHSGDSTEGLPGPYGPTFSPSNRLCNHHSVSSRSTRATTLAYQCSQLSFPAADGASPVLALSTTLDHPALEVHLVRQHVNHLTQDGTTLVLLVRGVDAVKRVAQLCGPESMEEAHRLAPHSWIARFGLDEVHDAVFAPRTVADAQSVISTLFPSMSDGQTGKAAANMKQPVHASAVANPPSASGEVEPPPRLTFTAIMPALRSQVDPQRCLSYYTGVTSVSTAPAPAACNATQVSTLSAAGAGQGEAPEDANVALAAQTAAAARASLATSYPKRRERLDELDRLLRQRAIGC